MTMDGHEVDPWSRTRLDDFWPRDNLPWEESSELLLRCRTPESYMGLRSFAEIDRHVGWIVDHLGLPPGARVLDLGCGPGLYANALAGHGLRVVGTDISEPLLRHAEAEADGLERPPRYYRASVLAPELGLDRRLPPFDAVLLVNSPLGLFDPDQVAAVVRAIAARLRPGGQLLCEVPAVGADETEDRARTVALRLPLSPLHSGPHRWVRRHMVFVAPAEQVTHHIVETEQGHRREYWSRTRLFTADRFSVVLDRAGLVTREIHGLHPGQPRRPGDETMFVWAARPAGEAA